MLVLEIQLTDAALTSDVCPHLNTERGVPEQVGIAHSVCASVQLPGLWHVSLKG